MGALAELSMRTKRPDIATIVQERAQSKAQGFVTHYRIMSVVLRPEGLVADIKRQLPKLELERARYGSIASQKALHRRIRDDEMLQSLLLNQTETSKSATDTLTFVGLYRSALGADSRLRLVAVRLLSLEAERPFRWSGLTSQPGSPNC